MLESGSPVSESQALSSSGSASPAGPAAAGSTSGQGFLDAGAWHELTQASTTEEFAGAWLTLQCGQLPGAVAGVVVIGPPEDGPFAPVAYWPPGSTGTPGLVAVAELAMKERRGVAQSHADAHSESSADPGAPSGSGPGSGPGPGPGPGGHDDVAYPLLIDNQLCGVAAIELDSARDIELRGSMRSVQWGAAWLEVLIRQRTFSSKDLLVTVLELVAICLEQERFQGAATTLVTELATRLECERVSLGFIQGSRSRVEALSHSAKFAKRTNLIRALEDAMDEAADQQSTIVHPPPEGGFDVISRAHSDLAQAHAMSAVCTVPLAHEGRVLGALTLERQAAGFDSATIDLCEHAALLIGPLLDARRREDRWIGTKVLESLRAQLDHLLGPRHFALKLATLVVTGLVVFFALAEGDYRVPADARLEGRVQRVVVAPLEGYIASSERRAGDVVKFGDLLCALDDKDLRLERVKWSSQRAQLVKEHRLAMAEHERARVSILSAQIEQADAQTALLDEQLARTRITAPFDGIIVSGDLTQQLGAPVRRGDVLFEVAPLDAYRIILSVDERDINAIAVGQTGELALSGLPGERFDMQVEKITPVSTPEEGRNVFRVEARLDETSVPLRPGMEGVGKVNIDRRKIIWIWTHDLVDWVRLWTWSWMP